MKCNTSNYCMKCGKSTYLESILRSPHRCQPAWLVRLDWMEPGDERTVHARDAESAAEEFIQRYDNDACEFSTEATVYVYDAQDGGGQVFNISGEIVPSYYVRQDHFAEAPALKLDDDGEEEDSEL